MLLRNKSILAVALGCLSLSLYAATPTFSITNHTDCFCTPIDPSNPSSGLKCHTQDQVHPGETVYVGKIENSEFISAAAIELGSNIKDFKPSSSDIALSQSDSPVINNIPSFPIKEYTDRGISNLTMVTLGGGRSQTFLAPASWVDYSHTACSVKRPLPPALSSSF